jgi:hypothetical protein
MLILTIFCQPHLNSKSQLHLSKTFLGVSNPVLKTKKITKNESFNTIFLHFKINKKGQLSLLVLMHID